MELFEYNKKRNQILLGFSIYCLSLLLIRAKLTNSIYLFFLIWNLFLAVIPYAITTLLSVNNHLSKNKFKRSTLLITWLAFLPNSFYIITDLKHIVGSKGNLLYLDLIIISSFAITGFLLGILSLIEIEKTITPLVSPKIKSILIPCICVLCGFGIYIGRVLRYNSWDIISDPFQLSYDILPELLAAKTILFSLHFGVFIYITYLFKKHLISNNYGNHSGI